MRPSNGNEAVTMARGGNQMHGFRVSVVKLEADLG